MGGATRSYGFLHCFPAYLSSVGKLFARMRVKSIERATFLHTSSVALYSSKLIQIKARMLNTVKGLELAEHF